jgi:hypothetical protein
MNQIKPIKLEDLDIDKIIVNNLVLKTYKSGNKSKQCSITYDYGNGIIGECLIKAPVGIAPFGISVGKEREGEAPSKYKKYYADMNLVKDSVVFNKFKEIDNKMVEAIVTKSEEWWGKKFSKETVETATYNSLIKISENNYPERYRVKCPFYEGKPQFKVFDQYNKKISWVTDNENGPPELDWSLLGQRNIGLETVFKIESLMDVNKKVFCILKALQFRVHPPVALADCAFDDPVDPVSIARLSISPSVQEQVPVSVPVTVSDESEEEKVSDGEEVKVSDDEEEVE